MPNYKSSKPRSFVSKPRNSVSKPKPTPKPTPKPSVYTLNLKGGKKYIGYSSNPEKRINDHFNGRGAKVTQENKPVSVHSVNKCSSIKTAKNAERIVYNNMKNYHGTNNVRGAGNTSRFSLSTRN
jgi:predicted GIY-YIG superfamily endonuclease